MPTAPHGIRQLDLVVPLMEALDDAGGRLATADAVSIVVASVEPQLQPCHFQPLLSNHELRIENWLKQVARKLRSVGLLASSNDDYGFYSFTDLGRAVFSSFRAGGLTETEVKNAANRGDYFWKAVLVAQYGFKTEPLS